MARKKFERENCVASLYEMSSCLENDVCLDAPLDCFIDTALFFLGGGGGGGPTQQRVRFLLAVVNSARKRSEKSRPTTQIPNFFSSRHVGVGGGEPTWVSLDDSPPVLAISGDASGGRISVAGDVSVAVEHVDDVVPGVHVVGADQHDGGGRLTRHMAVVKIHNDFAIQLKQEKFCL